MNRRGGVLMYHDVLGAHDSGTPGIGAEVYKISRERFSAHLSALRTAFPEGPALWRCGPVEQRRVPFMLTFDDGGQSATEVARLLETLGWRAHFFITTSWIGQRGFLSAAAIRALHEQGHVVGSHSVTHPPVMSALSQSQLQLEWNDSAARLSDIIGARVGTASVPGGYVSPAVVATAAAAGIEVLWTSEPRVGIQRREGVAVLGRFAVYHDTMPWEAVALAGEKPWAQRWQLAQWFARKPAKALLGGLYPTVRRHLLAWSAQRG